MFTVKTFTPAEAAKISGVSATLQRDWRRRGILRPLETGQARFTPFEVAEMMALNALAERGLSPLSYRGIAGKLGASIVACALRSKDSYSGAFDEFLPTDTHRLDASIRTYEIMSGSLGLRTDAAALRDDIKDVLIGWRAMALAKVVTKLEGYSVEDLDAFVQFADGSFEFYPSIMTPFEVLETGDPRLRGAVIVVSLSGLAVEFRRRTGSFVHIDPAYTAERRQHRASRPVLEKIEQLWALVEQPSQQADEAHG